MTPPQLADEPSALERADAPFADGPGEQADQLGGQPGAAPARGDHDGDVRDAVLLGWLAAGGSQRAIAIPRRVAGSTATSANRLM